MTDSPIREYLNSRMDRALDDAADRAKSLAEERGVLLSDDMVGEMALTMFEARMTLAMSNTAPTDFPEDTGRESY